MGPPRLQVTLHTGHRRTAQRNADTVHIRIIQLTSDAPKPCRLRTPRHCARPPKETSCPPKLCQNRNTKKRNLGSHAAGAWHVRRIRSLEQPLGACPSRTRCRYYTGLSRRMHRMAEARCQLRPSSSRRYSPLSAWGKATTPSGSGWRHSAVDVAATCQTRDEGAHTPSRS